MHKIQSHALPLIAAGALAAGIGFAGPTMAAQFSRTTTMSSAPATYGYSDREMTNSAPRCENVEQHYAHFPKTGAVARNGRTLVPGDAALGSQRAWQTELAIASSPVCR